MPATNQYWCAEALRNELATYLQIVLCKFLSQQGLLAAWYITRLLVKLTLKGVVCSFLSNSRITTSQAQLSQPVSIMLGFLSKLVHAFLDVILHVPGPIHNLLLAFLEPVSPTA